MTPNPTNPLGFGSDYEETILQYEALPADLAGCAVVLAHELGHALGHEDEIDENGDNVQVNENPARYDFGLDPRLSYHYYPIPLP